MEMNASGKRATQQSLLFDAVVRYGELTSAELARKIGIDRYIAARRLPELRDAGLIQNGESRKCLVTGRKAITWIDQRPPMQLSF
jgi:CRP-like cAMP-binding protein